MSNLNLKKLSNSEMIDVFNFKYNSLMSRLKLLDKKLLNELMEMNRELVLREVGIK